MAINISELPTRKSASGPVIDTRPLYVEEWLDTLPYIDFQKTGALFHEAISRTNKEEVKPAVRLELIQLYNRPYQYYVDSQIKTGAQHTLQSISSMQEQLVVLKKVAIGLGMGCKLSVDELLKRKTLWGQSKPPLTEMLMSLNYLSHAMIFSFLEYSPIPKNVWREANFIYTFAQEIGQENNTIILPGKDAKTDATSIAHSYKKIALASLADPHHLPFGAIWEIYEQLQSWAEFAEISTFSTPQSQSGYFVVNLDKDMPPLPISKFNSKLAGDKHRLIDTNALHKVIQQQLGKINSGVKPDSSVKISSYFAKSILSHMTKAWGLPPSRYFPRESNQGNMNLVCGLNACYFFVNKKEDFIPPQMDSDDSEDLVAMLEDTDSNLQRTYRMDEWSLVDEGSGGFAVMKNDKPSEAVRVGDLIGISQSSDDSKWRLGVIRWLMIRQNKIYKVGVQMIKLDTHAASIRAREGTPQDKKFRRAFLLTESGSTKLKSIITNKGLYAEARELELFYNNQSFSVTTKALEETTVSFDHFSLGKSAG